MTWSTVNSLEEAITGLFGDDRRITGKEPITGGDINRAYRLSLSGGKQVFMKCNAAKNVPFFQTEAKGLEALGRAGVIGVPKPLAVGADEKQGISFLLMEYLEAAPRVSRYWETFGQELAALHRADCSGLASEDRRLPFGFETDNYIGASPQKNTPKESWVAFFRDCRLLPQIRMADGALDLTTRKKLDYLLDHLDGYLAEPEFPSLIHGDLWSGNQICGPDGKAWILDPAAYVGHFEAELAMTELFGGFPASFFEAYHEVNQIDRGYKDRRELYNLYHLLNHLNLFGGSYLYSIRRILDRYTNPLPVSAPSPAAAPCACSPT